MRSQARFTENAGFFRSNASSKLMRRNNSSGDETIFHFSCRYPETAVGYQTSKDTADSAGSRTRRHLMRTVSFILAFAFILAGPSMAGSSKNGLPGIGTFSYIGSPVTTSAPEALVVAAR